MKASINKLFLAGFLLITVLFNSVFAQRTQEKTLAKITNVYVNQMESQFVINYDIEKYIAKETFKIWVNVYNSKNEKIEAKTLVGDIGDGVRGGKSKRIVWDMTADLEYLNDNLFVEVFAESQLRKTSTIAALFLSLACPGVGDMKLRPKKKGKRWMLGFWGYFSAGVGFGLMGATSLSYNAYLGELSIRNRDQYYTMSQAFDISSKVLFGIATAIWTIDLTALLIKGIIHNSKPKSNGKTGFKPHFSVGYAYEAPINQSMMSIKMNF